MNSDRSSQVVATLALCVTCIPLTAACTDEATEAIETRTPLPRPAAVDVRLDHGLPG